MRRFIDQLILVALCLASAVAFDPETPPVLEVCFALIFLNLPLVFEAKEVLEEKQSFNQKFTILIFILAWALCIPLPKMIFFTPVLLYNIEGPPQILLGLMQPLLYFQAPVSRSFLFLPVVCSVLSVYISRKTSREAFFLRDHYQTLNEKNFLYDNLQRRNQRLLENQELTMKNAVLQERNRISREIHDHVGHLLSSAIIQLGAVEMLEGNADLKKNIAQTRETLETGMESIRSSIHNIHSASLSLELFLKQVEQEFKFCTLTTHYDCSEAPPSSVHYAAIHMIKEALTNVSKHSDATAVQISFMEAKDYYHLLIADNGTVVSKGSDEGIGLLTIEERAKSMGGNFHLNTDNGYHLFITLPKEKEGDPS